eukprot:scaffold3633_cov132-Chaetoceros_neogracile.AAC.1
MHPITITSTRSTSTSTSTGASATASATATTDNKKHVKRMILKSSLSPKVIPNIPSTKLTVDSQRSPPPAPRLPASPTTPLNHLFRRKGNRRGVRSNSKSKPSSDRIKVKAPWTSNRKSKQTLLTSPNSNISPRHTPRSEKTILGDDKFDGIEVSLKNHGMEVLHVIGQESFEKERNIVTSPLNSMEGILGHTTRVFHQDFLTIHYHAVCDFDFIRIKHRVPIRGLRIRRKEEERRKDVKVDMELLESYPVLEEEEAVSVEMRHLWNEMKAIDLDRRGIAAKKKCNDTSLAVECDTRWNVCSIPNCDKHWDINIHLDSVDKRKPGSQNDSIH